MLVSIGLISEIISEPLRAPYDVARSADDQERLFSTTLQNIQKVRLRIGCQYGL